MKSGFPLVALCSIVLAQTAVANTVTENIARSMQPVTPKNLPQQCAVRQRSTTESDTIVSTAVKIVGNIAAITALSLMGGHGNGGVPNPCNATTRF